MIAVDDLLFDNDGPDSSSADRGHVRGPILREALLQGTMERQ